MRCGWDDLGRMISLAQTLELCGVEDVIFLGGSLTRLFHFQPPGVS